MLQGMENHIQIYTVHLKLPTNLTNQIWDTPKSKCGVMTSSRNGAQYDLNRRVIQKYLVRLYQVTDNK